MKNILNPKKNNRSYFVGVLICTILSAVLFFVNTKELRLFPAYFITTGYGAVVTLFVLWFDKFDVSQNICKKQFWTTKKFQYFIWIVLTPIIVNVVIQIIFSLYGEIFEGYDSRDLSPIFALDIAMGAVAQLAALPNSCIFVIIEEIWFRGILLNNIEKYANRLTTALIVGVICSLSQVLLMFLYGNNTGVLSSFFVIVYFTSSSIIYSWIYHISDKNLLICIFAHGCFSSLYEMKQAAALIPWILAPATTFFADDLLNFYSGTSDIDYEMFPYNVFDLGVNFLIAVYLGFKLYKSKYKKV